MTDEVAHENIEDVIIDGDGSAKTRHRKRRKEKSLSRKEKTSAALPINGQRGAGRSETARDGPLFPGLGIAHQRPYGVVDGIKRPHKRVRLRGLRPAGSDMGTRLWGGSHVDSRGRILGCRYHSDFFRVCCGAVWFGDRDVIQTIGNWETRQRFAVSPS
jgi:hypothetical protein